jgi:hypothetical protein
MEAPLRSTNIHGIPPFILGIQSILFSETVYATFKFLLLISLGCFIAEDIIMLCNETG